MSSSQNNKNLPTLEERFSKNIDGLLKMISSIVNDLGEEGLVEFSSGALDLIRSFISGYDINNVIWCLATTHKNWGMINSKNEEFILKVFPEAIKESNIPIDTRCITCPITCLKEMKTSNKWSEIGEEEWPVGDEDITSIWKYVKSLVVMVCKKIYRDRKSVSISDIDGENSENEDDKIYDEIDIEKWGKLFEIDYNKI